LRASDGARVGEAARLGSDPPKVGFWGECPIGGRERLLALIAAEFSAGACEETSLRCCSWQLRTRKAPRRLGSVDASPVDWPAAALEGDGELHGKIGYGGQQHRISIKSREQIKFIIQPLYSQNWLDSVVLDCTLIQRK